MNNIQLYIITAPITAFITCAFIIMFMSKIKMKPELRMTIVFVVYAIFAFVMGAGGNGIFNLDMSACNGIQYMFRLIAGVFVCLGLYLFYRRGDIADKMHEKQAARKSKGK